MGLSLYEPKNDNTYNSVKNSIQNSVIVADLLWLGIQLDNDNRGSYLSDGNQITVEDWQSGQPNSNTQNCVAMAKEHNFKWIDTDCSNKKRTHTVGAICASSEGKSNF